jgi:hypothetical protein
MNALIITAAAAVVLLAGILASAPWHREPPPAVIAPPAIVVPPLPKPRPPAKSERKSKPPKIAYSCADMKMAEAIFTQSQMEEKAKERGATPEQLHAAQRGCK